MTTPRPAIPQEAEPEEALQKCHEAQELAHPFSAERRERAGIGALREERRIHGRCHGIRIGAVGHREVEAINNLGCTEQRCSDLAADKGTVAQPVRFPQPSDRQFARLPAAWLDDREGATDVQRRVFHSGDEEVLRHDGQRRIIQDCSVGGFV